MSFARTPVLLVLASTMAPVAMFFTNTSCKPFVSAATKLMDVLAKTTCSPSGDSDADPTKDLADEQESEGAALNALDGRDGRDGVDGWSGRDGGHII